MIHHFNCQTICGNPKVSALIFDWNDETGEVSGQSAVEILAAFKAGDVSINPPPAFHPLTSTKNKTDMAAVIGWNHQLPPELADHYPRAEKPGWDGVVYDMNGNVVGQVQF